MKIPRNIVTLTSAAIIVASLTACSGVSKLKDGFAGPAGEVMEGGASSNYMYVWSGDIDKKRVTRISLQRSM